MGHRPRLVVILSGIFFTVLLSVSAGFTQSTDHTWPNRVLITNDDGIDMEEIRQLALAFAQIAETYVVAPLEERSGSSTHINLRGPLGLAITREQAIDAFTINSAYQLNQEHVTGSLEVRKFADLIVLDRNLFEIPIAEVSDTKVLMTVVGGKVVYSSES